MPLDDIVLIGSRDPVSILLQDEIARQSPGAYRVPLWPAGAGARRGTPPTAGSRKPRKPTAEADPAHRRMVVVLTWSDLSARPLDAAARAVAARLQEIRHALRHDAGAIVVIVPYASWRDGSTTSFQWLAHEPVERADAARMAGGALASLLGSGPDVRIAIAPMLVSARAHRARGYPSLLQKAVRLARCLGEEVEGKAPGYFTRYDLTVDVEGRDRLNVATPAIVAASVLGAGSRDQQESGPALTHWIGHTMSWNDLAVAVAPGARVRLAPGGRGACTALDDVFNELIRFNGALSLAPAVPAPGHAATIPAGREVMEEIAALARETLEPWESSYQHVTDVSLDAVDGCAWMAVDPDTSMACVAGGEGPAVVLIPPLGIEPGYFSGIVRELARGHRVIVWRTAVLEPCDDARSVVEANARGIVEALRRQGADACHLLAWCGGVRVAACLIPRLGGRIRSLSLLAPDICEPSKRSQTSREIAAMFTRLHRNPRLADETCAQLLKTFRDTRPAAKLDQYAPGAAQRKSPLQYHPFAFNPALLEELVCDTRKMLAVAREVVESDVAAGDLVETLAGYEGPRLLMLGTHDALVSYAAVRERAPLLGPCTLATVIGGNHYFVLEHADAVAPLLRRFMAGEGLADEPAASSDGGRIRVDVLAEDRRTCEAVRSGRAEALPHMTRGVGQPFRAAL